jgi:acetyltransferase-like isoleucine patch superfamily enzyme
MKFQRVARLLYYGFPLPAFLFGAVILGLSLWPAMLMVHAVYQKTIGWPDPLRLLVISLSCGLGYFVFGLSLLATIVVARKVTFIRSSEGTFSTTDWKLAHWLLLNGLLMTAWLFFLQFTRVSRINVIFYRLLGMKVGRKVLIDSVHLYDVDLIEIGDGASIGGDAVIMAHALEAAHVYFKRVRIGAGAAIGMGTIVLPGADIGAGAVIGAQSLVTKNMVIPPNTIWGGVPARKIKDVDAADLQEVAAYRAAGRAGWQH